MSGRPEPSGLSSWVKLTERRMLALERRPAGAAGTGGGGSGTLDPADILAGANMVVTDNLDGTVTVATASQVVTESELVGGNLITLGKSAGVVTINGRTPVVSSSTTQPSNPVEGDIWYNQNSGAELVPTDWATNTTKWQTAGFGYGWPGPTFTPSGANGMRFSWNPSPTNDPTNGQLGFLTFPFIDGHTYIATMTVLVPAGNPDVRMEQAFLTGTAVMTTKDTPVTLSMTITWHTGDPAQVGMSGPFPTPPGAGNAFVLAFSVMDVTSPVTAPYVYDSTLGWIPLASQTGAVGATAFGTAYPSWNAPGGSGSVVLPNTATAANPTTLVSIVLPKAGTWDITYWARAQAAAAASAYGIVGIFDDTGTKVPNSEIMCWYFSQSAASGSSTGTGRIIITTTGPVTYTMRGWTNGTTPITFFSEPQAGRTGVLWREVSGANGPVGPAGPAGPPGAAGGGTTFVQGTPATVWNITHALSFQPNVSVVDSGGAVVEGDVVYLSGTAIRVTFSAAFSGSAYLS